MRNRTYHIAYKMKADGEENEILVEAGSKENAYSKAWYTDIPKKTGSYPASVRVLSCIYRDGRIVRISQESKVAY